MLLALKIQHAVHHVLQHLGTCNEAILVHMADDEYGDVSLLGQLHELHGAVLHLPHAAGRRVQLLVIQGLYGVHDEHLRLLLVHALQHIAEVRFREYIEVFAFHLQPLGSEL